MSFRDTVLGDEFDLVPNYRHDHLIIKLYAQGSVVYRDRPAALVRLSRLYELEDHNELVIENGLGRALTSVRSRRRVIAKLMDDALHPDGDLMTVLNVLSRANISLAYAVIVQETWGEDTPVLARELALLDDECIKEAGVAIALCYRALILKHPEYR